MRLVCPNCDAQYEVDSSAIAAEGRDVQCSNCGHAWFQLPPDAATEPEADALPLSDAESTAYDDDIDDAPPEPPKPVAAAAKVPAQSVKPPPEPSVDKAPTPPVPRRTMDESLLAVLREEAERETAVRRSETPRALESQPDLGLEETSGAASAAKAVRDRLARLRGPEPEPDSADKPTARRDLLPDIEEINSTLRASSENRSSEGFNAAQPEPLDAKSNAGFRSGFSLVMLIAALALGAYLAAPKISAQYPASKSALDSYVASVDAGRVWLDAAMRNAISALQNLTAGS